MSELTELLSRSAREADDLIRATETALRNATILPNLFPPVKPEEPEYIELPELDLEIDIDDFTSEYINPSNDIVEPEYLQTSEYIQPDYPIAPEIDLNNLFDFPKPDTSSIGGFNLSAPTVNDVTVNVDVPDVTPIATPVLSDVNIGDTPELILPTFSQKTVIEPVAQIDDVDFEELFEKALPEMKDHINNCVNRWVNDYAPTLKNDLALLQSKITEGLSSTNILDVNIENDIYTRARGRVEDEVKSLNKELETGLSRRGFKLPQAALSAGRVNIRQQGVDNLAKQALEISIEREKMEIQHLQFVMQLSQAVNTSLIGNSLQYANIMAGVMAQSVDYAKAIVDNLVSINNLKVSIAGLRIDELNAEVKIYETEIKSALSALEGFKLELEAEKLKLSVDDSKIRIYESLIKAESLKLDQALTKVKIADVKAGIEKTKVDIFSEQVKAYNAEVGIAETEAKVYLAAIQGDKAKADTETIKLKIYSEEIKNANLKADHSLERIKSETNINSQKADQYKAALTAYVAEINAERQSFGADVDAHRASLATKQSILESKKAVYLSQHDAIISQNEHHSRQYDSDIELFRQKAQDNLKRIEIHADTGVAAGEALGRVAQAALASQGSSINLSEQVRN